MKFIICNQSFQFSHLVKIGFWGLPTGAGCAPCGCDPIGAYNSSCHDSIGQCYCKPGVGGTRCDVCLPGYYGYSSNGCQGTFYNTMLNILIYINNFIRFNIQTKSGNEEMKMKEKYEFCIVIWKCY